MTPTGLRELRCPHCRRLLGRFRFGPGSEAEIKCYACNRTRNLTIPGRQEVLQDSVRVTEAGTVWRASA